MRKKDGTEVSDEVASGASERPVLSRSDTSIWGTKKITREPEEAPLPPVPTRSDSSFSAKDSAGMRAPSRRGSSRSASDIFWPVRRNSKEEPIVHEEPASSGNIQRPSPLKSKSDTAVVIASGAPKPPAPSRSNTTDCTFVRIFPT
jgi:hypothetical protein